MPKTIETHQAVSPLPKQEQVLWHCLSMACC